MGAGVAAWVSSAISLCKLLWNGIIGTLLSTSSHTTRVLCTIKLCEQVFPTAFAYGLKHVDGSGVSVREHPEICHLEMWCLRAFQSRNALQGSSVCCCVTSQMLFILVTVLSTSGLPNILDLCCCSSWSVFLWMVLHFNVKKFQRGLQLVLALPSAHESFLGRCRLNPDR